MKTRRILPTPSRSQPSPEIALELDALKAKLATVRGELSAEEAVSNLAARLASARGRLAAVKTATISGSFSEALEGDLALAACAALWNLDATAALRADWTAGLRAEAEIKHEIAELTETIRALERELRTRELKRQRDDLQARERALTEQLGGDAA